MSKAIVDTTVLTDILLNTGEIRKAAETSIQFFSETLLPVFAIKEFKAGPLKNFVWMHNKLVTAQSFVMALDALQKMSRTPKRYTTSTAIQALKVAAGSIAKKTPLSLGKKYGEKASIDIIQRDEFRLSLKSVIIRAWEKRRKITTSVIYSLPCYREIPPQEKRGLIYLEPKGCTLNGECSLAPLLRKNIEALSKMRDAIKDSEKPENKRRASVLRQIQRTPKRYIGDDECKKLGDAIFVLLCPDDTVILTTNTADHLPLAQALGKEVVHPKNCSI